MGVNAFLLLSLALASQFMLALADNDTVCTYEGQRFRLDRQGQLPLETHYNCYTEIECKEKCDAKSTCIIWQWQPTRRICWIMDVVPYPDRNSDFGINNCDKGKPTENAPLCVVTKGDRNNVWQDYRGMTKDDCELECILDSNCLIWQHIRSKRLCRIHKLEIDISKKSQVGIHYCSNSKPLPLTPTTPTTNTTNSNSCYLNRVLGCCAKTFNVKQFYVCESNEECKDASAAAEFAKKDGNIKPEDIGQSIMIVGIEGGLQKIDFTKNEEKMECVGKGDKMIVYKCAFVNGAYECTEEAKEKEKKCEFRFVEEGLKAIHCTIDAKWTEMFVNKELFFCDKKRELCKDCDSVATNQHAKTNFPNIQEVEIYSYTDVEWNPKSLENGKDLCFGKANVIVNKCKKSQWSMNGVVTFTCSKKPGFSVKQSCEFQYVNEQLKVMYCTIKGAWTEIYNNQDLYTIDANVLLKEIYCNNCNNEAEAAQWRDQKKTEDLAVVISAGKIDDIQRKLITEKGGTEVCVLEGVMSVYECNLWEQNGKNHDCINLFQPQGENEGCKLYTKDGNINIFCTEKQLQIYPSPSCENKEHFNKFYVNHLCAEAVCKDELTADEFSRDRNEDQQNPVPVNSVIVNSNPSKLKWTFGNQHETCNTRGKIHMYCCYWVMDSKRYFCAKYNEFKNNNLECSIQHIVNSGHLKKVICNVDGEEVFNYKKYEGECPENIFSKV